MITATGNNGTVDFDGRTVSIRRESLLARMTIGKGEKRIPLTSIAAIQLKPAGAVMSGYIEFTVMGGVEMRSQMGSATRDASHNENAVVFARKQMPEFERLRDAIEAARYAATPPAVPQQSAGGLADQLQRLAELARQGVLSVEEFESAKRRLIGG